jgi:DeoR/GlpR family transcriptional regulator of sugar metabolism
MPNNIKHQGINLTKEVKDLCNANYTTVKKEIKKTVEDGKTSRVPGLAVLIL